MKLSNHGVEFISHFENVYESRYCPYWDSYGGVYTRGFGETDWNGNFGGRCISHAEALSNLRTKFDADFAPAINDLGVPLNQDQFDALASFVWNLGPGSMSWNVGQELRARNYYQAAQDMLQYDTAGGVVLGGLVERRRAEYDLFMSGSRFPSPRPNPPDPFRVLEGKERYTLDLYIKRRKHPRIYKRSLNKLFSELVYMRQNIYDAAVYGRLKNGTKVQKGWKIKNRWDRYVIMRKYTVGK